MTAATGGGVLVLHGPKAVGKSAIAAVLAEHNDVAHVDPDVMVSALQEQGVHPDAATGWLGPVNRAVRENPETAPMGGGGGHRSMGQRLDAGRPARR